MMKEEELKTQIACYTDQLLKSKRENKWKAEQLECNYELIKHFYTEIYIYPHTQILSYEQYHKETQNFRHLQWETYVLKLREIKIMMDSYSQQALLAIPTTAVPCFFCITSVKYQLIAITNGR